MTFAFDALSQKTHLKATRHGILFNEFATEILVIDRRGRVIRRQIRLAGESPLEWTGRDQSGRPIDKGQYLLRIDYPRADPIYVPFIIG